MKHPRESSPSRPLAALSILLPIMFAASWSPQLSYAADYYVGATGGGNGSSAASLQTLGWANANLLPGDVAHLCDTQGDFSDAVAPARSGSEGMRIVYRSCPGQSPRLTGALNSIVLVDRDYITVDGLSLHNPGRQWIEGGGSHCDYNTIQNCIMTLELAMCSTSWAGIDFGPNASYNRVVGNTIVGSKEGRPEGHYGVAPRGGRFSHNLFDGNNFGGGFAHAGFSIFGHEGGDVTFNVLRGNTFDNPLHTSSAVYKDANHTLIEGNVIRNASAECLLDGDDSRCDENICGSDRDRGYVYGNGLQTGCEDLIIRRNVLLNNQNGLVMDAADPWESVRNRIYHNTFFGNRRGIESNTVGTVNDNVLKFNIFDSSTDREIDRCLPASGENDLFIGNNFRGVSQPIRTCADGPMAVAAMESAHPAQWSENTTRNPQFEDTGSENFNLRADSELIDAAGALTQVNGAGTGTSLQVDDARYFYSGDGEPWLILGDPGDTVFVDSSTAADFTVEIASIDYATNTLILQRSQSWDDNALVYHCPNGVCFVGTGPDVGALEAGTLPACLDAGGAACCGAGTTCPGENVGSAGDCGGVCCSVACVPIETSGYSIRMATQRPTIDGDLSEFASAEALTLTGPSAVGTYKIMWDSDALYIGAEVLDVALNASHTDRDGPLWLDDGLEIMFDTSNDGGAAMQSDDFKVNVTVLNTQLDFRGGSLWDGAWTSAVVVDGTNQDNTDADNGYRIEVEIPWGEFGVEVPTVGTEWGLEVILNDRAADSGIVQTAWTNSTDNATPNDPDGWGSALFTSDDGVVLVTSFGFDNDSESIMVGESIIPPYSVTPSNATTALVTLTVSDPSVATVLSSGHVQGLRDGVCTIYGQTTDGTSIIDSVELVVGEAVNGGQPTPDPDSGCRISNASPSGPTTGLWLLVAWVFVRRRQRR